MRNSIYKRSNVGEQSQNPSKPIQNSVMNQNSTIQEFLNMRRVTKDKGCLIIFLFYCLGLVIMMGVGFFYGNYNQIGYFTNNNAPVDQQIDCTNLYLNQQMNQCSATCPSGYAFLGKVCLNSASTNYNPSFSNQVLGLISMYNIKYTFSMITYVSASLLAATAILFVLIIYFPKIIYVFISALFVLLLGLAFYLLKNVQQQISQKSIIQNSIFYSQQQNTRSISFVLLGIYLVIFPFILFSPKKIKLGIIIIGQLKQFYLTMKNMIAFSFFVTFLIWGSLIIEIFLVMNFYTSGTISKTPQLSMFHTYEKINLSHPASLTFHFFGIFWLYGTVISWHKFFVSSSMCLWYFQDSQSLQPIKRGLKRSLHHVGSAALDGILIPLQWVFLLLYSILKTHTQQEGQQDEQSCIVGCFTSIRSFFMYLYKSINRNSPCSSVLTNFPFFQSCFNSAQIFSMNSYRFFNIGGTITIFLTLFVCIFWIIVMYFVVYFQVYNKQFPSLITSIVLPIFCVFIIALVIGSLFANIFTASLDCLLFCYLIERKSLAEGESLERGADELPIKTFLDEWFYRMAEQNKDEIFIYEEKDQNSLEITYVSKKQ